MPRAKKLTADEVLKLIDALDPEQRDRLAAAAKKPTAYEVLALIGALDPEQRDLLADRLAAAGLRHRRLTTSQGQMVPLLNVLTGDSLQAVVQDLDPDQPLNALDARVELGEPDGWRPPPDPLSTLMARVLVAIEEADTGDAGGRPPDLQTFRETLEAEVLRCKGWSWAKIAKRYGISDSAVRMRHERLKKETETAQLYRALQNRRAGAKPTSESGPGSG